MPYGRPIGFKLGGSLGGAAGSLAMCSVSLEAQSPRSPFLTGQRQLEITAELYFVAKTVHSYICVFSGIKQVDFDFVDASFLSKRLSHCILWF